MRVVIATFTTNLVEEVRVIVSQVIGAQQPEYIVHIAGGLLKNGQHAFSTPSLRTALHEAKEEVFAALHEAKWED